MKSWTKVWQAPRINYSYGKLQPNMLCNVHAQCIKVFSCSFYIHVCQICWLYITPLVASSFSWQSWQSNSLRFQPLHAGMGGIITQPGITYLSSVCIMSLSDTPFITSLWHSHLAMVLEGGRICSVRGSGMRVLHPTSLFPILVPCVGFWFTTSYNQCFTSPLLLPHVSLICLSNSKCCRFLWLALQQG